MCFDCNISKYFNNYIRNSWALSSDSSIGLEPAPRRNNIKEIAYKTLFFFKKALTNPSFPVKPREVIGLRVVVAEFHVMVIRQLFYLCESYPVALWRECY